MKHVSKRILPFFEECEQFLGLPRGQFASGLDLDYARPPVWIPWSTFCELYRRVEAAAGDTPVADLGRLVIRLPQFRRTGRILRLVTDTRRLFRASHLWGMPGMFPALDYSVRDLPDGRLGLEIVIPDDLEDSPTFFRGSLGFLRMLPHGLGFADVDIEMELSPRRALYRVRCSQRSRLRFRLLNAWSALQGRNSAFDEMAQSQRELRELYEEKSRAFRTQVAALAEARNEAEGARRSAEEARGVSEQAQRAAAAAREVAERALRMKNEFMTMMRHEVRTPLGGVIGVSQLLDRTVLSTEQQELMELLHRSSARLKLVLDEILDFSRLQDRSVDPERAPFAVTDLIADLRACLDPVPSRCLSAVIEPEVPRVIGDARRIRDVLQHLVDNATTHAGSDRVRIHVGVEGEAPLLLRFKVSDWGCGIPAESLPFVFEPFTRLDTSNTQPNTGIGMGLAICRELVEQMGGEISARSRVGSGSTFTFILPLPAVEAET